MQNVQGAKKIIFTACHSGKLQLAFTSPNIIILQLAPKAFWWVELISQFFCYSNCSKNITCPSKTEFISLIAKSNSPGLSDIKSFFAHCAKQSVHAWGVTPIWNRRGCSSRAVARKKLQPRQTHGPLYEISRMKSSNIVSLIKKIKIESIW